MPDTIPSISTMEQWRGPGSPVPRSTIQASNLDTAMSALSLNPTSLSWLLALVISITCSLLTDRILSSAKKDIHGQTRVIFRTLFAPETLVLRSLKRAWAIFDCVRIARANGFAAWTWRHSFLATSGLIFVEDETDKIAALPQLSQLSKFQIQQWKPAFQFAMAQSSHLDEGFQSRFDTIAIIICFCQLAPTIILKATELITWKEYVAWYFSDIWPLELYTWVVCLCTLVSLLPFIRAPLWLIDTKVLICVDRLPDAEEETLIFIPNWASVIFAQVSVHVLLLAKMIYLMWAYFLWSRKEADLSRFLSFAGPVFPLLFVFTTASILYLTPRSGGLRKPARPSVLLRWSYERVCMAETFNTHIEWKIVQPSAFDKVKSFIQKHLDKPILWWPLTEPLSCLPSENVNMACFEDHTRLLSINVSLAFAERFLMKFIECQNKEAASSSTGSGSYVQLNSLSSTSGNAYNQSGPSKDNKQGKRPQMQGWINPQSSSMASGLQTNTISGTTSSKFIHWCVGSSTAYVENICVEAAEGAKTGTAFIKELISIYNKRSGLRQRWFSLLDLADVKIIQFVRILDEENPVACRQSPVKVADIKAHPGYEIDTTVSFDDEMHILWAEAALKQHLTNTSDRDDEINKLIAGLPRIKVVTDRHLARSTGYGIIAKPGWAVWKFLIMAFLAITVGLTLFIWWLVKHPGDLQNASVPFFMVLAAMSLLVAIPDYLS